MPQHTPHTATGHTSPPPDKPDIFLVSIAVNPPLRLQNELSEAGFNTDLANFTDLAATIDQQNPCDILLFNLSGLTCQESFDAVNALAETIKSNPATRRIRILCVGIEPGLLTSQTPHHFDEISFGPLCIPSIIARVTAQLRLNTIQSEIQRRQTVEKKYAAALDQLTTTPAVKQANTPSTDTPAVLLTGAANDLTTIQAVLSDSTDLTTLRGTAAAEAHLQQNHCDLVLINAGDNPAQHLPFAEALRKNPALFNLPVLMVANPSNLSDSHIPFKAGITDIIDAPVNANELLLRTRTLTTECRYRSALAPTFDEPDTKHTPATRDALTGHFNYGFFREHLDLTVADHRSTGKIFTLVIIAIDNIEEINNRLGYAEGDKVLTQIAQIISLTIRGEDLAARTGGRSFTLTLPDTNADRALSVLHRLESLLLLTELTCQTGDDPITISLTAEIIEFDQEGTATELLARHAEIEPTTPEETPPTDGTKTPTEDADDTIAA